MAQVTELKFRGLELKRGPTIEDLARDQYKYPVTEITESQHKAQTIKSLEAEELRTREDQIRELQITDPLAYEKMLANNELEGTANDDEFDDGGDSDVSPD